MTLTRDDAPPLALVSQTGAGEVGALESRLVGRLENLERSVRELEARRDAARSQPVIARAGEGPPVPEEPRHTPPPVDDPVFEAAVLDILERAEEGRDSEREVRRNERARQRSELWANELGMRLALSPGQAAKLLEVRSRLEADLKKQRQRPPEGAPVPREQRRAATQALRESAEKQVREVLDHRQLAEYEKLAPDLKLLRSDD